jgi:hypothetical protein
VKRVIAIALVVNAAMLAANLLGIDVVVHAAGGGGVPLGNGDVNGDGAYDVSDAVYFLNWRFLGGPVPTPIVHGGLSATGQAKCYDAAGAETDCKNVNYPGQDSFYLAGSSSKDRFEANKNGFVTDTLTGLMWQKGPVDIDGNGLIDENDFLDWQAALWYCKNLSFAGYDDWRLPNLRELQSIVNYGREESALYQEFWGSLPSNAWVWSSTSLTTVPVQAWVVYFDGGISQTTEKSNRLPFRAVRGGL